MPGAAQETTSADLRPPPWYRRHPAAFFLGTLILAILSAPYTEEWEGRDFVEASRLTVVLLAGLFVIGRRRFALLWGLVLVAPTLVAKWLDHLRPEQIPDDFFLVPGVLFVAFVIARLLSFILRAPHVNSEVLCAAISGYLLMGLLWAMAYTLLGQHVPNAFSFTNAANPNPTMQGFTALYFSFVTLGTVGYGDIAPISHTARLLAMVEAIGGIFYMTILIARLVSVYSADTPKTAADNRHI